MRTNYTPITQKAQFNFARNTNQPAGEMSAGDPEQDQYDIVTTVPVRPANFQSEVLVPAGQSLMTAVVTGLPAVIVALWLRWDWYSPIFVGSCSMLVTWFSLLSSHKSLLLSVEEKFAKPANLCPGCQLKLNHKQAPGNLIVSIKDYEGSKTKIVDLPGSVSDEQFALFCAGVANRTPLARSEWVGAGKPLTRAGYDELMRSLEVGGMVIKRGKAWKTTERGRRTIEGVAAMSGEFSL